MNNNNHEEVLDAEVSHLKRVSGLWLIPIITILVGVWMVYDSWASQGPLITIEFASAEGLVEGKTKIKTRNVEVGKVERISLNQNLDGVVITARMNKEVKKLLTEGARFWVVQPSIGFAGVSGLSTIFSGQYIEFLPVEGEQKVSRFEGLSKPPLTPPGTPGLHITLSADGNFSFSEGDVIYYQGNSVGKIEDVHFNASERTMYYNAFIESPFHKLITTNTRFWDTTGLRVEVTTSGVSLETGPFDALVTGGISFGIPEGEPLGKRVTERNFFHIYSNRSAIYEKQYVQGIDYVLLIEDSVRGLNAGSPVVYRGLTIGKVMRADYIPKGGNLLDRAMKIPIFIKIEPGRLGLPDNKAGLLQAREDLEHWIRQGLTATIKSRNFLLGQQMIELNYEESPEEIQLAYLNEIPVIPLSENGISKIADGVIELVAKMGALPIESIGNNLDQLLTEGTQTLKSIEQLAQSGGEVVVDAKNQQLIRTLNETLSEIKVLAQSFSGESPVNNDIHRLLETMADAFTELRPLLTELKNKPNGLIFTSSQGQEPEPERKQQ